MNSTWNIQSKLMKFKFILKMKLIAFGLIFINILRLTICQRCATPPVMSNYSIASYGQGIWYTVRVMTTMETALNFMCSRGIAWNNGTHFFMKVKGIDKGFIDVLEIEAKKIVQSVHKWELGYYNYKGMDLFDVTFDVSTHDKFLSS